MVKSMRSVLIVALACGMLSVAGVAPAQDYTFIYDPSRIFHDFAGRDTTVGDFVERTPAEAVEAFQSALGKIDRIDYSGALEDLARAAALAPQSIELQFLSANWNRRYAEMVYGDESLAYYDQAETALRRLLANPQLGPEERDRALRLSERVREAKDGLRARDQARFDTGFNLVLSIRDERLERSAERNPALRALRDAEQARRAEARQTEVEEKSPWQEDHAPGVSLGQAVAGQITGTAATNLVDPFAQNVGVGGGTDAWGNPIAADPFAAPAAGGDPFGAPAGDPFGAPAGDPFGAPATAPAAPAGGGVAGQDFPL
jgi:tetratricopeptide (TPR) repeat protein